jgi:hypothetical protein
VSANNLGNTSIHPSSNGLINIAATISACAPEISSVKYLTRDRET